MVFGAVIGIVVGATKGLVEGTVEGFQTACTGNILDVITAPVGALGGALFGTASGTTASIHAVVRNPANLVSINPIKCAEDVCDIMEEIPAHKQLPKDFSKTVVKIITGEEDSSGSDAMELAY